MDSPQTGHTNIRFHQSQRTKRKTFILCETCWFCKKIHHLKHTIVKREDSPGASRRVFMKLVMGEELSGPGRPDTPVRLAALWPAASTVVSRHQPQPHSLSVTTSGMSIKPTTMGGWNFTAFLWSFYIIGTDNGEKYDLSCLKTKWRELRASLTVIWLNQWALNRRRKSLYSNFLFNLN